MVCDGASTKGSPVFPSGSCVAVYLPAFLTVGEVAVSREPSGTELLPRVGVLIGLVKMSRRKNKSYNAFTCNYDLIVWEMSTAPTGQALLLTSLKRGFCKIISWELCYFQYAVICSVSVKIKCFETTSMK